MTGGKENDRPPISERVGETRSTRSGEPPCEGRLNSSKTKKSFEKKKKNKKIETKKGIKMVLQKKYGSDPKQKCKDEEFVKSVTRNMTLNIFKVGSDPKNYELLGRLPTTMKDVMWHLKVSKMPANRRINELEKAGLLKRDRYEGKVHPTPLTHVFMKTMEGIQEDVMKEIPKIL